ncbi:hypothetical protein V502_00256 [Pseudogymnoascus sp. VKM F-4520 (FW-2644)]|nr:hypothetical protein V502_00256 [Pseudogymnoascus sp. VKM F-4520 (FW-2644)]
MGHIINLTVQAFLFDDNEYNISLDLTVSELDKWRLKGALGKLHNIVVFIQRSPQRIAILIELSGGKRLERDNSTRWNSWAHMISCALRSPIRRAIRIFCQDFHDELEQDILDIEDWAHTETGEYSEPIEGMCNSAWNKLTKYYNLTGTSVAYVAAVVLDPRVKWVYFTWQWPDWIDQAQADMLTHWNTFYKGSHTGIDHQETSRGSHDNGQSEVSKFREQNNPQDDEVLTSINSIVSHHACLKKEAYPDLSRWAIDILSIPALSDEPERLFSRAGNTLDEGRVQLLPETVQALECIKSWTLQKIGIEGITEHRQLDEEVM